MYLKALSRKKYTLVLYLTFKQLKFFNYGRNVKNRSCRIGSISRLRFVYQKND
jgi:hypothetical protein